MKRLLVILTFLLVFAPFAPVARAQSDIEVTASIDPQRAYLGSTFTYTITVRSVGNADVDTPQLNLPGSIRAVQSGNRYNSRPRLVTGPDGQQHFAQVSEQQFVYSLSSTQLGRITIDPVTVNVNGKPYTTEPVTVDVLEPETLDGFELEARLSKPRAYVGEPVTLRVTWYVGDSVRTFALGGEELPSPIEAEALNPAAAYRDRRNYPGAELFGEQVFGTISNPTRDGRNTTAITFEVQLRANQPGSYQLGPIAVVFDTAPNTRASQRGITRSEPITLDVRPLPTEGRPADFAGLIGEYQITASASPTEVSVGDPISLDIVVTGTDPLAVQAGPDLPLDPNFANSFKTDPGGWERDQTGRDAARFHTTIRATSDAVTEIPPVRLPYFDVASGTYSVATSKPIPLSVRAASTVTLADAVTSSVLAPTARERLGDAATGLWSIAAADELAGVQNRVDFTWIFTALVALPPLLVLGHWLIARARAHVNDSSVQERRAYAEAVAHARRGRVEQAVRTLLASRLSQTPAAVTAADCARVTTDSETARTLTRCLTPSEYERFGGPSLSDKPPTDAVLAALKRVHRAPEARS